MIRCVLVLVVALLAGCAPPIEEGLVVGKRFVPEHVVTSTHHIHLDDGIDIPITTSHTVPDEFTIWIQQNASGGVAERGVAVDKQSFQLIKDGDWLHLCDLPLSPTAEYPRSE